MTNCTRMAKMIMMFVLILGLLSACSSPASNSKKTEIPSTTAKGSEAGTAENSKKTITIATAPVGSSYNAIGSGLASVISTNSSIKLSVKPYAGINAWAPIMNSGEIEVGVASSPEVAWAFKGENGYKKNVNLRALVIGNYIEASGAVVRKDLKVEKISDLKGKRLTADYPGSIIGKMVLEATLVANGLTWDDVKKVPVPTTVAGIEALRDNRVDAAFALAPTTPVIVEADNAVGLKALNFIDNLKPDQYNNVSPNTLKEIRARVPGARMTKMKPEGYIREELVGIEYPAMLLASASLSEDTAYQIMKTLWTHYEKLHPIHGWLKTWTPETMFDPNPSIPYHPGAVKFFKEKGLWKDEAEKNQQELMMLAK